MHHSKSYMLPKMIFVNLLALMMITCEQLAPAEVQARPQTTLVDAHSQPAQLKQISATTESAAPLKKASVKKAVFHMHKHKKHRDPQLISASATPLNCCFRGNL